MITEDVQGDGGKYCIMGKRKENMLSTLLDNLVVPGEVKLGSTGREAPSASGW